MKITVLGSGAAEAIPNPYCQCSVCQQARSLGGRECRARSAAIINDDLLIDLGPDYRDEAPKTKPVYYFRPDKTILVRTVQDGGESYYIRGDHRETVPNLYNLIIKRLAEE